MVAAEAESPWRVALLLVAIACALHFTTSPTQSRIESRQRIGVGRDATPRQGQSDNAGGNLHSPPRLPKQSPTGGLSAADAGASVGAIDQGLSAGLGVVGVGLDSNDGNGARKMTAVRAQPPTMQTPTRVRGGKVKNFWLTLENIDS